jgi:hypothetical protein
MSVFGANSVQKKSDPKESDFPTNGMLTGFNIPDSAL